MSYTISISGHGANSEQVRDAVQTAVDALAPYGSVSGYAAGSDADGVPFSISGLTGTQEPAPADSALTVRNVELTGVGELHPVDTANPEAGRTLDQEDEPDAEPGPDDQGTAGESGSDAASAPGSAPGSPGAAPAADPGASVAPGAPVDSIQH